MQRKSRLLCTLCVQSSGTMWETTSERQNHRETLCSVIYVCLNIIYSKGLQMKKTCELYFSRALIILVPNFDLY